MVEEKNLAIKFSSFLTVITIIVLCEVCGGMFLKNIPVLSLIEKILIIRIFEIVCMMLFFFKAIVKKNKTGVIKEIKTGVIKGNKTGVIKGIKIGVIKGIKIGVIKGIKIGVIWSFYFGLVVLLALLILWTTKKNPLSFLNSPIHINLNQQNSFNFTIFLLTYCIIGPIAEELFFRGFVYSFFRQYGGKYRVLTGMIVSSFLFSLCHISSNNTIAANILVIPLIGGFIFCLSYEYSKNLATPIVIHILGNIAIVTKFI